MRFVAFFARRQPVGARTAGCDLGLKRQRGKVERVLCAPLISEPSTPTIKQMNLSNPVKLVYYYSQFILFQSSEPPGTTLLVHPQPRVILKTFPFLTKVTKEKKTYLPVVNNSRSVKEFKGGTLLGSYDKGRSEPESVLMTRRIHNDRLPESYQYKPQGERLERLQEWIK